MTFPGPSRTIIVEPVETPEHAPAPSTPPEHEPAEAPEREPARTPEREPVPAR